ncbi:hypothetical protein Ahy_A07g032422 [Arachis hypogaea]|uniref:Uncharacterized protein n=1 Tax=Arachis hypogaea TaxID=3818 RepID=A0A445C6S2_ARAHY|nr:hypothetical protein Ahy_A07g032422 [Arachis hypogaea]
MQGMKNYSIRRNAEYQVVESDCLKYHVHCCQAATGCSWSLRVALRQNFGYWKVQMVGRAHTNLICNVILLVIQSNPSVSIPILQGSVRQNYHFKSSYRKVWIAKKKEIAHIYGDWEESYNKGVPCLLC